MPGHVRCYHMARKQVAGYAQPMSSADVEGPSAAAYTFKSERFSSHALLLQCFPAFGKGRTVIDVGGGEGYLSRILADRGFRIVCIAAPGTVARDFPGRVEVIEADLDVDHPDLPSSFDYALCGDVLEHLRYPSRTLRWLRRVLRPDGSLVASLPNSANAYVRLNVLLGRFPQHDRGLFDRTHLHFYSLREWEELFDSSGYQLTISGVTAVPIGLLIPGWRHNFVMRALEGLSYGLARLWRKMFAYQFVAVARPSKDPSDGSVG